MSFLRSKSVSFGDLISRAYHGTVGKLNHYHPSANTDRHFHMYELRVGKTEIRITPQEIHVKATLFWSEVESSRLSCEDMGLVSNQRGYSCTQMSTPTVVVFSHDSKTLRYEVTVTPTVSLLMCDMGARKRTRVCL